MADKNNKTISVNRAAMEKLEAWVIEVQDRNPKLRNPSHVVNLLIIEFLKQVTTDPELAKLDAAVVASSRSVIERTS